MSKLECKICGKQNLDSLILHLVRAHGVHKNEYIKQFNYTGPFISNEQRTKVSIGGRAHYADPLNKQRYLEHQKRKRKNNPEMYKKNSKTMAINTAKGKNGFQSTSKSRPFTNTGKTGKLIEYDGNLLRSKAERHIAGLLKACNINYEYEAYRIAYELPSGYWSCYIPDFYLPDYNLILEVKGSKHIFSWEQIDRMYIIMSRGFKFMFVNELTTKKELENYLNAAPLSNGVVKTDLNCWDTLKSTKLQRKDEINLIVNVKN